MMPRLALHTWSLDTAPLEMPPAVETCHRADAASGNGRT